MRERPLQLVRQPGANAPEHHVVASYEMVGLANQGTPVLHPSESSRQGGV
jgi:hypothetical protein